VSFDILMLKSKIAIARKIDGCDFGSEARVF
jgi:hypothetical protein